MADFVQKPNTGRVWPNNYRKGNDKAPHYTGNLTVDRTGKFDVSMWVNYAEDGKVKDVSLRMSEPYVKDGQKSSQQNNNLDDEVPF